MKKQVLVMVAIIIVLSIVGLLVVNFNSGKRDQRRILQPILGEVDISDIQSIVINDRIELRLNSKIWSYMVEDVNSDSKVPKPTRQDYVQDMLEELSKFSRGRLVESTPTDLAKYHLDDDAGGRLLVLKDKDDIELMRIKIGVIVGALSANYAQINDNPAVYEVGDNLITYLNQSEQYWQDLRLFPNGIATDKVQSIKIIKRDRDTIELVGSGKSNWTNANDPDMKINPDIVATFLGDVQRVKAANFSKPTLAEELYNGDLIITMNNSTEYKLTVYFFANKYFGKTVGGNDNEVLSLQEYNIEKLFPTIDYFKEAEEEELEVEEAVESEEVTN